MSSDKKIWIGMEIPQKMLSRIEASALAGDFEFGSFMVNILALGLEQYKTLKPKHIRKGKNK